MVCSLVLATTGRWNGPTTGGKEPTDGVYFYRIEPKNGITDPAKYKDPLVQLIQDDDCFYSAICSMGCFGVIYSVVFEVMQMWLEETRMETTLDKLMSDLRPDTSTPGHFPKVLQNTRNYEVIIHPYPLKDGRVIDMDPGAPPETYYPYFSCLVTQRHIVPKPHTITGSSGHRNIISQLLSRFKVSFELVVALLNTFPGLVPFALTESMASLVDASYINKSFDIYNLGLNQDAGSRRRWVSRCRMMPGTTRPSTSRRPLIASIRLASGPASRESNTRRRRSRCASSRRRAPTCR